MGEWAYNSLVSEFLWIGIEPKYALKLAALRYPDEKLSFKNNDDHFQHYAEMVMDMCFHKYDEFNVDELLESSDSLIYDIRKKKEYKRVCIYIDGANLLRSFAFVNQEITLVNGVIERKISTKIKNYNQPVFNKEYPVWYISEILIEICGMERALIDKIVFVMCADDKKTNALLKSLKTNLGFEIITPEKIGKGLRSSSNEDKVLKDLIVSDLENDVFDLAVLGTGDGNKKDGISFPEIAARIKKAKKQVLFAGFDITTSKKIKKDFEFIDIGIWALFPGIGGSEIRSNEI